MLVLRRVFLLCCLFSLTVGAFPAAQAQLPSRIQDPKLQEVFAPYWTAETGWATELRLANNLAKAPLSVTPVLRLASGKEIALDPVSIASHGSVSVWVNSSLLKHAPGLLNQPGSYGSVVFRFTSMDARNLHAAAVVSLHGQSVAFHIPAHPLGESEALHRGDRPGSREGIWWQPRPGLTDTLVVSNSGAKTIHGTLSLFDASGKPWRESLSLKSHETRRISVSDLLEKAAFTGNYGGIKFEVAASAPARTLAGIAASKQASRESEPYTHCRFASRIVTPTF